MGFHGQEGCHEFSRVVRLEVGRLVGDHGVGGAVTLVKGILGELLEGVEKLGGFFALDPFFLRSRLEPFALGPHFA